MNITKHPRGALLYQAVLLDPWEVQDEKVVTREVVIVAAGPERFKAETPSGRVLCQGTWHCNQNFLGSLKPTPAEAIANYIGRQRCEIEGLESKIKRSRELIALGEKALKALKGE